jgi:ssDNA-binding Zn-finger/Zn-ribbon topoisomerase 1
MNTLPVVKCCNALDVAFKQSMIKFVSPEPITLPRCKFIKWFDIYDSTPLTSIHCPFCGKEIKQLEE